MTRENDDFTLHGYRRRLEATVARYPVAGFEVLEEPDIARAGSGNYCIIRHDIDISPPLAVEMAEIEAELGVRATYAVLLTGSFYNAFASETRSMLRRIADLGHDMALHFDAAWHGIENADELEDAIGRESAMLSDLLHGARIDTFIFHNTTDFTLSCGERHYGGLRNAYARDLGEKVGYVSDSNGYWRFKSWEEALAESPPRLQVLTHPEWWPQQSLSPAERVCRHIERQGQNVWRGYSDHLRKWGRENRADLPEAIDLLVAGDDDDRAILQLWLTGHRHEATRRLAAKCGADEAGARTTVEANLPELFAELAERRARSSGGRSAP
jgi:hypothetical protein